MDNDSAEVLRRRIIALERRLNDSESELKIVKQNPKYVLIQNIRGLETRMLNVVNANNILRTRNKELKEQCVSMELSQIKPYPDNSDLTSEED